MPKIYIDATDECPRLQDMVKLCREEDVGAVTYMPTRNTLAQLERLRDLCDRYGMFQISGEDINSPRQSFVIRAMENPMFSNLIDATWKLIEHENSANVLAGGKPCREIGQEGDDK